MRKIVYVLLFSCLILFQSCFEIIEQVFLKNDGSGNFQLVINLSKSKTKLNSFIKMKTVNGHAVPSKAEISQKIEDIKKAVAKTSGITNTQTTVDFDNYIATLTCNFNKIEAINNAVKNISDKEGGKIKNTDNNYEFDPAGNIFTRYNKFSLKKDYDKMSNADKEVFATANYTVIYKFEGSVAAVTNKSAKVSPSKKAVMLQLSALDIITGKKSLENKIKLIK